LKQKTPAKTENDASSIQEVARVLGNQYKLRIIFALCGGRMRFIELKKAVAPIGSKSFCTKLRELANDGLVTRRVRGWQPVRVEYSLTSRGEKLILIFEKLRLWGREISKGRAKK
jgi:DNA-binding HxlR family transcriptional regulator